MATSITINALKKVITEGKRLTLLDVRRKSDFAASSHKIPGALWQDPETISTWAGQLPRDRQTIVYCVKGGSVSQSVADHLEKQGVQTTFLEGGLKAWMDHTPLDNPMGDTRHRYHIQQADMELLKKAGLSQDDIAHSVKVAQKALEIAGRTIREIDMELVGRGALFHDLGKAQTHGMVHGKLGAEMGAKMGLPPAITDVMEKHIRGGLTPGEAVELGLPVKDYTLEKLEERIIIYADRLVDIITEGIVSIKNEKEAEERFEEILRTIPKYGKNEITLERYLTYHREIQALPKIS